MTTTARKRTNDFQLNTWNVRSLTGPGVLEALIQELTHYDVNITAIQETKLKDNKTMTMFNHCVFLSNSRTARAPGVGFIVDAKWSKAVIDWKPINDRICVLRVRGKFFNYSLINVYAPHNERSDEDKDNFYSQLDDIYAQCPQRDIKIIIGDLNAKVGREEIFRPTIGKFSMHMDTNENGLRLISFAAAHNMEISSTFFQHKTSHKITWLSPGSNRGAQIDHLLVDKRHATDIMDVRTFHCTDRNIPHHDSDHLLVGARIRARLSNLMRQKCSIARRFDSTKYNNQQTISDFRSALELKLDGLGDSGTEWKQLRDVIVEAAEQEFGYGGRREINEWFDEECADMIERLKAARVIVGERVTRSKQLHFRKLQRDKKKMFRKKKRDFERQEVAEIERLHMERDTRRMFQKMGETTKAFVPVSHMCRKTNGELVCDTDGVLARWKEHFEELLNEDMTEEDDEQTRYTREYLEEDGKDFPPPDITEVDEAIRRLKNHKAPGDDGITAEILKAGGSQLVKALHSLILRIWSDEKLPEEWMISVICPIHKKGDKLVCSNYRGISLQPLGYKVFAKILAMRLEPLTENYLQPFQAGFRRGMSTTDQVFCVRQIVQKSYEKNVESHHLFIDFKAAYDSIDREELWEIMVEGGYPHKLIRLLKATLDGSKCCVKIQNRLSEMFESKKGLRQGDENSTKLFNITLEGIVRRAGIMTKGSIFTKSVQLFAYADDIDIAARSFRAAKDTYSKLEKEANRVGLTVNEQKTKYMMISPSERTQNLVGTHFEVNDKRFEVVHDFTYLGSMIDDDYNTSLEIKKRLVTADRAFYANRKLLTSKNLSWNTKFIIYKTKIRPVATYCGETWNCTQADNESLNVFERKVLRTIIGPKRVAEDEYRSRYNHELYEIYKDVDLATFIRLLRVQWAGHVWRRSDDETLKQVYNGDFREGRRSRGRPKGTWMETMLKDCEELNIRDWRTVFKDKTQLRQRLDEVKARARAE